MMQDRFESYLFQANRSINLKDWEDAARNLRTIIEMIPDRGDDRYKQAEIKLIDVERRLQR